MGKVFKRSFKIPIYGGRLFVLFCDNLEEAEKHTSLEFDTQGRDLSMFDGGCFQNGLEHYVILEHETEPGIIAHECKHFVNHVFHDCGVFLDTHNDEAECYLLGWAVNRVYKTMEKRNAKK